MADPIHNIENVEFNAIPEILDNQEWKIYEILLRNTIAKDTRE